MSAVHAIDGARRDPAGTPPRAGSAMRERVPALRAVSTTVVGGVTAHDSVHVVTVTHNSLATLDAYFAGIAREAACITGVTVVDNASTDGTLERLRALAKQAGVRVEVIENSNTGFAGGYAAAAASGIRPGLPLLALNPDVSLAEGTISSMLEVLNSHPRAGVVTAPLVELDGTPDSASRRRLPTFGASVIYSVLGRLTPTSIRYNARTESLGAVGTSPNGARVSELEATTGALMLIAPDFRTLGSGVFDRDYWMYGEDLQLCADARAGGREVLMAEVTPSTHVKGASSGRPRSRRSNRAFHDAMAIYARKNLVRHPLAIVFVRLGVEAHFLLSEVLAVPARLRRRLGVR